MKGTISGLVGLVLALCLALPEPALSAAPDTEIGYVSMKSYLGAKGQRVGGEPERLTYRREVYSDEIVRTGGQSMTALRFLDDTTLQVSQLSEVVLDRFIYDPDRQTGEMVLEFARGAFRFVTGEMTNLDGFVLRTPSVLIGIRGTDFKLLVDSTGATTVAVLEGEVEVTPLAGEAGAVTVATGHSVSVSATGAVSDVSPGDAVGRPMGLGDDDADYGSLERGKDSGMYGGGQGY